MPSFTPVNQSHAPFPYVNPMQTRHDRALDSDFIYDRAYDNYLNDQSPKGKAKRRSSAAGSGRMVSLGRLWEYRDEEDVHYQDQGFGTGPTPKKLAPSKRSKSAKPPGRSLNHMWEYEEARAVIEEPILHNVPQSQQATLSDTQNYPRRKLPSRPVKEVKIGPFKNPVITKPIAESGTKQEEDHPAKPASNHARLTTTQEAVKLSKTILDKLARFRYGCPSKAPPLRLVSPKPPADIDIGRLEETRRPQVPTVPQEKSHSAEKYEGLLQDYAMAKQINIPGPEASIDSAHSNRMQPAEFQQAAVEIYGEEPHMQSDAFFNAAAWNNPYGQRHTAEISASNQRCHPEHGTIDFKSGCTNGTDVRIQNPPYNGIFAITTSETAPQSSNFEGFTSSGMQLMEELLAVKNDDEMITVQTSHANQDSHLVGVGYLSGVKPDVAQHNVQPRSIPHTSKELPRVTEVQPPVSKEIDMDDFGDDIDDADLLELDLTANISVAGSRRAEVCRISDQKQPDSFLDDKSKVKSHRDGANFMTESPGPQHCDAERTQGQQPLVPSSDLDDEYPLDAGDEEDMLNFPELEACNIGNYEAPAGLEHGVQQDLAPSEVYHRSLQLQPPISRASMPSVTPGESLSTDNNSIDLTLLPDENMDPDVMIEDKDEVEDWSFIRSDDGEINASSFTPGSQMRKPASSPLNSEHNRSILSTDVKQILSKTKRPDNLSVELTQAKYHAFILDDSHEYELLAPFARPNFPATMRDRSPVVGLSAQSFLRVCFRVGEMFKEGRRCEALNCNAVIELFARVTFSSREVGTTRQHFQFVDLWHDRPPYPTGVLANYKSSGLTETESRVFVGASDRGVMARCLAILKREKKSGSGWLLHIRSIRETDWEEIRWTRRIVSAGQVKSEH